MCVCLGLQTKGGRDMWQRQAMEAHFKGTESNWAFTELIRVVGFNISNGPYRGLWVRAGPRPFASSARSRARVCCVACEAGAVWVRPCQGPSGAVLPGHRRALEGGHGQPAPLVRHAPPLPTCLPFGGTQV